MIIACIALYKMYNIFRSADLPEHAFKVAMKELKVRYNNLQVHTTHIYQQSDDRRKFTINTIQPMDIFMLQGYFTRHDRSVIIKIHCF